jgi:hypothetical protein
MRPVLVRHLFITRKVSRVRMSLYSKEYHFNSVCMREAWFPNRKEVGRVMGFENRDLG